MKNAFNLFIILFILQNCFEKKKSEYIFGQDNFYYANARKFREKGKTDSAFYYYNLATDEYLKINDSLGASKSLINMAIIQCNNGDYFGSIETSLEANSFLEAKTDSISRGFLASNFNNLAVASNSLKNYDEAEKFYKLALNNATELQNKYVYYNNVGDVLITKGLYKKALPYLDIALKTNDSLSYARALNNWARAKFLDNHNFNPIPHYHKAFNIRLNNGNTIDLNSSYANLCDYYKEIDFDIALKFAKKMENAAIKAKSSQDQLQALKRLIMLDKKNYQQNFRLFTELTDQVQLNGNRAKNQYALIRYGVEKSKAENSILKVDKLESQKKLIYLVIAVVGLLTIIIIGNISYKKRRKRLEQEKELEVKNTELKYSKKVHDVLANGIYQVMIKLENNLDIGRDETLDDLEYVYNRSRNISYDSAENNTESENFYVKINKLLGYFSSNDVGTILIGNEIEVWKDISDANKAEVYQVLRELLINMKKHSEADRVTLRFERTFEKVKVFYSDTGIGINDETILKNGVRNMVNRIENMGGSITFETQTEKGLEVNFSFPIS